MGYIAPKQNYNPSPYSANINGNGRIDAYANNIPKTAVSTQFYNPELFKDAENIRVNFTYADPKIIVTPSPYDRLNSGNSNYDKNTARKNNSSSQTSAGDNNHKSPTFDYNNYGNYNSDDNYYGYGGYDSYGDYGQGNNYSNLTEEKSTYKDDLWSVITSPPPPFTEYDDGTKNTANNYPTNQIVEDEYDRLIKGWRNGTVGVAELLTTLGSLATDVITSVRGRSSNTVDSTLKNALLGDIKSINTLESASEITATQANALRRVAINKKIDDILKNTKKLDKTSGRANQYEKAGNFDNALNDFYSLKPTNIQKRDNGTITGTLADGRSVNVRIDSSDKRPTLEIQNTSNNYTKIRYGVKP